MSASCCGAARRTAALVVMAAALGGIAVWLTQPPRLAPPVEIDPDARQAEAILAVRPGATSTSDSKLSEDIMSLPIIPRWWPRITVGSRVDVIASRLAGDQREVFSLLENMEVLNVGPVTDPLACGLFPDLHMASFAVNKKQARVVALANQLNCNLELVPRQPGAAAPAWDYDATLARLKGLQKELRDAEVEVAPFPRAVP